MRHFGSIVLSLIVAPLIYLLTGVGLVKFAEANEGRTTLDFVTAALAVSALLLAGVFLAFLTAARLSPLGPMLAGLGFLAVGFWALVDPASFHDRMPEEILGVEDAAVLPAGGLTVLVAVPLLATVASSRRWRGYDRVEPARYGSAYGSTEFPPGATVPGFPQTGPTAPRYPTNATEPATPAYQNTGLGSPAYPHAGQPPPGAPGSPAYPRTAPGSPAYPRTEPGSPAYPRTAPGSPAYPPDSPAYPPAPPGSPTPETATPVYPLPGPTAPTWPRSEDLTDASELTRRLPKGTGQHQAATHPPPRDPPTDPEATRHL
jgi:hypothetical protein